MRHTEAATRRTAFLAAALLLAAAGPEHRPATPGAQPIHVEMRDVVLYPYDDVPASVSALSGTVSPERPAAPSCSTTRPPTASTPPTARCASPRPTWPS